MSCMVPVNSTEASERAIEALLRRREEKMALTPIKLVHVTELHAEVFSLTFTLRPMCITGRELAEF